MPSACSRRVEQRASARCGRPGAGRSQRARRRSSKPSSRRRSAIAWMRRTRSARKSSSVASSVGVGVVEPVAEDVQVLVLGVHRRELDRGRECDVLDTRPLRAPRARRRPCRGRSAQAASRLRSRPARRRRPAPASRRSASSATGGRTSERFCPAAWPGTLSATPSKEVHDDHRRHYRHRRRRPDHHRSSGVRACRGCAHEPGSRSASVSSSSAASRWPASTAPRPTRASARPPRPSSARGSPQREAEAERAQAELHQERAGLHEKGMADHELIDDSEREKFAGTSAMSPGTTDRDADGVDDRREALTDRNDSDGRPTRGTLDDDYERGRRDEAVDEGNAPARFDARRRHRARPHRRADALADAGRGRRCLQQRPRLRGRRPARRCGSPGRTRSPAPSGSRAARASRRRRRSPRARGCAPARRRRARSRTRRRRGRCRSTSAREILIASPGKRCRSRSGDAPVPKSSMCVRTPACSSACSSTRRVASSARPRREVVL